jgi:hypothetical protein
MAFLDETLLHLLLQWHTFYWNTDQHGRILSDGLFHAFSTLLLLWGAVRLWRGQGYWTQPLRSAIVAALFIPIKNQIPERREAEDNHLVLAHVFLGILAFSSLDVLF